MRRVTLILILALVAGNAGALTAQAPSDVYEAVLQRIGDDLERTPVVLNNTVVGIECIRGGCKEPWMGTFTREWLEHARTVGWIVDFCVSHGYCSRRDRDPVPGSALVMLSTLRPCGVDCVDVIAHQIIPHSGNAARQVYVRYRLTRYRDVWTVTEAEQIAHGFVHG
jgi:hypothetical protein